MDIADQRVGHVRLHMAGQFEVLAVGADGQRVERISQTVAEFEVDRIQLQLARLDLREIENVVQQCQQRLG